MFYDFFTSQNQGIRKNYDNLYSFIKKSRNGFIINDKFEHINEEDSSKFYLWDGSYLKLKNQFSPSYHKNLSFTIASSNPILYSDYFEINDTKQYYLNLFTKSETLQTNKALVGVEFYDNDNNIITSSPTQHNLTFSSLLNIWYRYVLTNTTFNHNRIEFNPPAGTVKVRFLFRLWQTNIPVDWKDISIYETTNKNPQFFYKRNQQFLEIESKTNLGNYTVELNKNEFLKTSEKIPVIAGKTYTFQVNVKENLPVLNNSISKALFAIECYDKNGTIVVPSSFPNLNYSSSLNMYYRYIDNIKHYWTLFKSSDFIIPNNVASIKIIIRNFNYENSIQIDNVQLSLKQAGLESGVPSNIGTWSQITPTTIKFEEPLIHENIIDVTNFETLNFSATMREVINDNSPYNGLFAVEFFTDNFEHITEDSYPPTNTNLTWSSYYNFWYRYFVLENLSCGEYTMPDWWFLNGWHNENIQINVPLNAKWARLSAHNMSGNSNNEVKLLNIQINTTPRSNQRLENILNIQDDYLTEINIYPNPVSSTLYVDINVKNDNNSEVNGDYFIYDIQGNIVINNKFDTKNFGIDNLNSFKKGHYIIIFVVENNTYSKHFIIK